MKQLIKDEQYYDEYIKTTDHDVLYLLNYYLSQQFNIKHVRSHQDKRKHASKLTIVEKLNIAADELVGTTSEWPINSHINNTFAIHLDGIYQLNKYRNKIRSSSGTREARKLMQGRYHWTDRQVDSIEWELVSSSIFTQTYATRKTMTKYNHQRLMSNNKTIDNQMICPYCHQTKESFDHDQFLTCIESGERKYVRIQSFKQLLA